MSDIYREQTSGESKTTLQEKYTIFINNIRASVHILSLILMLHVFITDNKVFNISSIIIILVGENEENHEKKVDM